jgi:hypothetical protein
MVESNGNKNNHKAFKRRLNFSLALCLSGFFIILLGADPGLFGLDLNPLIGFVQTATFSTGLALLCLGGFISLKISQRSGQDQSLAQDIGIRLVATGYLVALISGMADVFGFGTQAWPAPPFFGPTQAVGVVAGEFIIALGFLLYMPFFTGYKA